MSTQDHLRTRQRRNRLHRCTSESSNRKFAQWLTETRSPRHMNLKSLAIINGCIYILPNHPQKFSSDTTAHAIAIGIPLNAQHRAVRLTLWSRYRNWTNERHRVFFIDESAFVYGQMTTVDLYGGFHGDTTLQPISSGVIFSRTVHNG